MNPSQNTRKVRHKPPVEKSGYSQGYRGFLERHKTPVNFVLLLEAKRHKVPVARLNAWLSAVFADPKRHKVPVD